MNKTCPTPQTAPPGDTVILKSLQLFSSGREVRIDHAGEIYRLRLTSNNKLILTK
ncbi:hemin uptake protein HemP [Craterilacuibacter sp.]|uniref:hemin uptake protein HemP n=1 Tax=Craterilacuibacter sp. TaxID=2870909 RepID=UPI003F3762D5